jgi:hypothetical protein
LTRKPKKSRAYESAASMREEDAQSGKTTLHRPGFSVNQPSGKQAATAQKESAATRSEAPALKHSADIRSGSFGSFDPKKGGDEGYPPSPEAPEAGLRTSW